MKGRAEILRAIRDETRYQRGVVRPAEPVEVRYAHLYAASILTQIVEAAEAPSGQKGRAR